MCFSATASFAASGVLMAVGTMSIIQAKSNELKWLSSITILFGIQHLAEGIVWTHLDKNTLAEIFPFSRNLFLFIAWTIWPIYIPWVFSHFVKTTINKRIIHIILASGVFIGITSGYSLLTQTITTNIDHHHILYQWRFSNNLGTLRDIIYVVCALLPPFLTGNRKLYILGIANLLMFIYTIVLMRDYLISIWCFLAAISSIIIYLIVRKTNYSDNKHYVSQS
jgi:hypothetical protein